METARQALEALYQQGNIHPLCDFVEQKYFKIFHNRDYAWSNELTLKTAFLTLLFNDTFYIMESETALERSYADLTMIVRPDMRQYGLLDILLEFKYVSLKEAGLNGEQLERLGPEELGQLPAVQKNRRKHGKAWPVISASFTINFPICLICAASVWFRWDLNDWSSPRNHKAPYAF